MDEGIESDMIFLSWYKNGRVDVLEFQTADELFYVRYLFG